MREPVHRVVAKDRRGVQSIDAHLPDLRMTGRVAVEPGPRCHTHRNRDRRDGRRPGSGPFAAAIQGACGDPHHAVAPRAGIDQPSPCARATTWALRAPPLGAAPSQTCIPPRSRHVRKRSPARRAESRVVVATVRAAGLQQLQAVGIGAPQAPLSVHKKPPSGCQFGASISIGCAGSRGLPSGDIPDLQDTASSWRHRPAVTAPLAQRQHRQDRRKDADLIGQRVADGRGMVPDQRAGGQRTGC